MGNLTAAASMPSLRFSSDDSMRPQAGTAALAGHLGVVGPSAAKWVLRRRSAAPQSPPLCRLPPGYDPAGLCPRVPPFARAAFMGGSRGLAAGVAT